MLYKSKSLTLEPCEIYVFGWDMFIVSIYAGAQVAIFTHFIHMWTLCGRWDRLCTLGRAPRTKETLPDFRESCRIARHSRVFRGLTGSQRTPGNEASHQSLSF